MKKLSFKRQMRRLVVQETGPEKQKRAIEKVAAFLREFTSPPHYTEFAYASLSYQIREGETSWLM